jgi:hypothetical protein
MVLHHKSLHGPFFIWHIHVGPAVTHSWCLQFVIKVSAWSFLHPMCTCGTLIHLTCGTQCLTWYVYLWGISPSPSDLWDLMAYVSLVLVDPSPSDLWDLTTPFSISIQPMGPDCLRVTCTYRTFLHLHLTYGTRRLACHLWTLLHLTYGTRCWYKLMHTLLYPLAHR